MSQEGYKSLTIAEETYARFEKMRQKSGATVSAFLNALMNHYYSCDIVIMDRKKALQIRIDSFALELLDIAAAKLKAEQMLQDLESGSRFE